MTINHTVPRFRAIYYDAGSGRLLAPNNLRTLRELRNRISRKALVLTLYENERETVILRHRNGVNVNCSVRRTRVFFLLGRSLSAVFTFTRSSDDRLRYNFYPYRVRYTGQLVISVKVQAFPTCAIFR